MCERSPRPNQTESYAMNFAKVAAQAAITGALGFAALGLGVGAGTASADPGCWGPGCNAPGNDGRGDRDRGNGNDFRPQQWDQRGPQQWDQRGPQQWGPQQWDQRDWNQRDWNQRGFDDARFDHQPFDYQGQRVEPYFDNDRGAWGFWFLGQWIQL